MHIFSTVACLEPIFLPARLYLRHSFRYTSPAHGFPILSAPGLHFVLWVAVALYPAFQSKQAEIAAKIAVQDVL